MVLPERDKNVCGERLLASTAHSGESPMYSTMSRFFKRGSVLTQNSMLETIEGSVRDSAFVGPVGVSK